jgi:hypothetical protein
MYTAARDRVNRNEPLWPLQKLIAARVASARYFSPGADGIQQFLDRIVSRLAQKN